MMGTLHDEQKKDWKTFVLPLVHAYKTAKHETTGFSPHYIMFGQNPRLAIDAYLGLKDSQGKVRSRENYAQKLRNNYTQLQDGEVKHWKDIAQIFREI